MAASDIALISPLELKHGEDEPHQDFPNEEDGRPEFLVFCCQTLMND